MLRYELKVVFLVLMIVLSAYLAGGQVATGMPPFGSFAGGPFDTVDLGNLNVHFTVPVLQKAARGAPFTYSLGYDSSVWYPVTVSGSKTWQMVPNAGWSIASQATGGYVTYTTTTGSGQCSPPTYPVVVNYTIYSNWVYHDQFGFSHPFNFQTSLGAAGCTALAWLPSSSASGTATDGSGIKMAVTSGTYATVTLTNGTVIVPPVNTTGIAAATQTDANGNVTSINSSGSIIDTTNQTVLSITGAGTPTSSVKMTYTASGGTRFVEATYAATSIKTNFGCSNVSDYTGTVNLVSRINLPDGSAYIFAYEQTVGAGNSAYSTGRIASITLPTGGQITYAYPNNGTNNSINCADGSVAVVNTSNSPPHSLVRTLTPGGAWTYDRTQTSGNQWKTVMTTPPDSQNAGSVGNDTVIQFQADNATTTAQKFYETLRQSYQGSSSGGTLLVTNMTCWNSATPSPDCTAIAVSSPIARKTVTLQYPGGRQSKVDTFYNNSLVTGINEYDFGNGAPAATYSRSTSITYAALSSISDHPSQIMVSDGSGNLLSKTTYTYDESAYPLVASGITAQHVSVSGARGNATTVTRTVGATTLTTHTRYYDTGSVYATYDVNGAITTYAYSTAALSCNNTFATSVTLPISGLSSLASTTWNCIGGVATAGTDINGNTSSMTYDTNYWRSSSVTSPYSGAATTTTNFTYTPYNTSNGNFANVKSSMAFNGTTSIIEQLTTMNQFGQAVYSQQHEGPSSANWDTTQVSYDSFLRPYQSSMPCATSSSTYINQGLGCPSSATTVNTYDALGRVTKTTDGGTGYTKYTYNQNDVLVEIGPAPIKQKQLEYDALGRLAWVCEITSTSGGACGTTGNIGYWTKYSYTVVSSNPTVTVTQNAQAASGQQTRVYTYDLVGRLISEQNPETSNLVKRYTYDVDSTGTCSGTYSGDLVKVVDAKANTTCYQYDVLHRVTQITYPNGPDSANTPAKTFVYDSATFNGTAMSNPKGRMVEAYTAPSGSKKTDEFFTYSNRGELTDIWECSPHSGNGSGCSAVGNYYHVTANFWENGALKTLSAANISVATQNYGVDSMGRLSTVTASSGQNPVTGVNYDLPNFKTTVTYGSLDSDEFTVDPNTGRMKQYKFNVNGNANTGVLNWNANGSLGSLNITDTIPGTSDTQLCNYTHDDLQRIASVSCANGGTAKWNQNFTYDAFGNITKTSSGPGISFTPGYDTAKNWITSLPGITPTTDNNGQMTYDGTHNYGWDVEGKMLSFDTTTLTYDALGRMVEKAVGSVYTQVVYSPAGGTYAIMNGLTLTQAFIPLPSGGKAVYTSAGLAYYRHSDHLGNSRLATTSGRALYSSTAYAPYGEPYAQSGTTDLSFTAQDPITSPVTTNGIVPAMYDFLYRKHAPVQGRWLSPDPAGLSAVEMTNPQTWNRYGYVGNNPLSVVDPLGMADTSITVYGCPPGQFIYDENGDCTSWDFRPLSFQLPIGANLSQQNGILDFFAKFPTNFFPQPPMPQKGFCSFTASGVPQDTQTAIQQIYNQAGVGIDFVSGSADLSLSLAPLMPGIEGIDSGLTPHVVATSLYSYPVAEGIIISHEWGHYLLQCGHGLPYTPCGERGLMASGFNHPNRGIPSPDWSTQDPHFQFTGQQAQAIQNKCNQIHPSGP